MSNLPEAQHPTPRDEPALTQEELDRQRLAPDTARSYDRAEPFMETGHDRMDCPDCPPWRHPDEMIRAVHNAHESHQLNSESQVHAGEANRL